MAKNYEVSFQVPLTDVKGNPLKDEKGEEIILGVLLAETMANSAADKNITKLYNWACTIAKGESLSLDSEEIGNLKSFIELLQRPSLLLKGQCLEVINAALLSKV